jgi:hypothetical protein
MLLVRNGPLSEVALSTIGYKAAIEGSTRVYRTLAPCLQYCSSMYVLEYPDREFDNSVDVAVRDIDCRSLDCTRMVSGTLSARVPHNNTHCHLHQSSSKWMHRRRLSEAVLCVSTHVHKQSPGRSVVRFRRRQAGSSGNRLHGKEREQYQEAIQVRGYNCQHSTVVKT